MELMYRSLTQFMKVYTYLHKLLEKGKIKITRDRKNSMIGFYKGLTAEGKMH